MCVFAVECAAHVFESREDFLCREQRQAQQTPNLGPSFTFSLIPFTAFVKVPMAD